MKFRNKMLLALVIILMLLIVVNSCSKISSSKADIDNNLEFATEENDYEYVGELLDIGANGNKTTDNGVSYLYYAIRRDYDKCVLNFVSKMEKIEYDKNVTPIMECIISNSLNSLKVLVDNGFDVNEETALKDFETEKVSPIDIAAYNDNYEAYMFLKNNGANVTNRTLYYSLRTQILKGNSIKIEKDIISTLKMNNIKPEISDILLYAIDGNVEKVNELLQLGRYTKEDLQPLMKITCEIGESSTFYILKSKNVYLKDESEEFKSSLIDSIYLYGNTDILQFFYDESMLENNKFDEMRQSENYAPSNNLNIEKITEYKINDLKYKISSEDDIDVFMFVNNGASLEGTKFLIKSMEAEGYNAKLSSILNAAVSIDNKEVFDYILDEYNVDDNDMYSAFITSMREESKLYYATRILKNNFNVNYDYGLNYFGALMEYNNIKGFNLLKEYGYDFKKNDEASKYEAIDSDRYEILQLLIDEGLEVKTFKFEDETKSEIMNAVSYNNHGIFDVLLKNGKDVIDFKGSKSGKTALHAAAESKDPYFAKELVKNGADRSIKDKNGKTPLELAKKNGNKEIIEILEK